VTALILNIRLLRFGSLLICSICLCCGSDVFYTEFWSSCGFYSTVAWYMLSFCVCLSVTSQSCTKTAM